MKEILIDLVWLSGLNFYWFYMDHVWANGNATPSNEVTPWWITTIYLFGNFIWA
jgi:hypothetical protein